MIADALWLGGITAFVIGLVPHSDKQGDRDVTLIARALADFAPVGTAAVTLIMLTGLFNGFVNLGTDFTALFESTYG